MRLQAKSPTKRRGLPFMCCSASAVLLALLTATLAGTVGLLRLLLSRALLASLLLASLLLAALLLAALLLAALLLAALLLLARLIALLLARPLVGVLVHYAVLSNGWLEVSFDDSPAQRLRQRAGAPLVQAERR
jgi:hypothetical protein